MKKVVPSFMAVCKKFNDSGDRDHGVPCRVHFLEISIKGWWEVLIEPLNGRQFLELKQLR